MAGGDAEQAAADYAKDMKWEAQEDGTGSEGEGQAAARVELAAVEQTLNPAGLDEGLLFLCLSFSFICRIPIGTTNVGGE